MVRFQFRQRALSWFDLLIRQYAAVNLIVAQQIARRLSYRYSICCVIPTSRHRSYTPISLFHSSHSEVHNLRRSSCCFVVQQNAKRRIQLFLRGSTLHQFRFGAMPWTSVRRIVTSTRFLFFEPQQCDCGFADISRNRLTQRTTSA